MGLNVDRVEVRPYAFPLGVHTARASMTTRRGWHVVLGADGFEGWGDAAPWPGFGAPPATIAAELATLLVDAAADRPLPSEAAHALEQARLDLQARRAGVSLAELLAEGRPVRRAVRAHRLVENADDARAAVLDGFDTLKVKIGLGPLAADVDRVMAIRDAAPGAALRLDANGAWDRARAPAALAAFSACEPAWIEQPLPADDLPGLIALRRRSPVPLAIDESLARFGAAALAAGDVAVIKPMFVGGLRAARALVEAAERRGLAVCITHALDSWVGRLGALHLAAAVGGEGAHGVAGAPPTAAVGGVVTLPDGPGLGVDRNEAAR